MRRAAIAFCVVLAGCAQPPAPEIVSAPQQVVVVEKQVIVERPATVPLPPPTMPQPQAAPRKPPPPPARPAIIVVDGDTVEVSGVRWRLKGFDAPEIVSARCDEERALGLKAKARLEALLSTGQTELLTDNKREHFGRTLGTIKVNGRDVGDILIAEKLAVKLSGARKHNWCPSLPAIVAKKPLSKSPCAGLLEAACKAPTCRWVKHASQTDKHGRPLTDYCRVAGKA